jgi:hypothetical protein
VEGVADNLSEQRERSPEILEGITVHAIGSVGIPGEDDYVPGSSIIQLRKPGCEIPDALEDLALAADQLLPGTLGLNPRDELARQIGWGRGIGRVRKHGARHSSVMEHWRQPNIVCVGSEYMGRCPSIRCILLLIARLKL